MKSLISGYQNLDFFDFPKEALTFSFLNIFYGHFSGIRSNSETCISGVFCDIFGLRRGSKIFWKC